MKRFFVFILIAMFGLSLAGCTSAVELSGINTNISSYYFVVDFSYGYENLAEGEKAVLKNKVNSLAGNYLDDLLLRYYSALSLFEENGKINSNEKIIYRNHLTPSTSWENGMFSIQLDFYSKESSRIFILSSDYAGITNEESAFKTVSTEKFSRVFSKTKNNLISTSLEEYFLTGAKTALSAFGEETSNKINNTEFYYMFVTENVKLRAANANEMLELSGGTIYCFYANNDFSEIEFEFYVIQANRLIYYLICLAIAFTFVAIYLMVIYFKKPKSNSNGQDEQPLMVKIEVTDDSEG